MEILWKGTVSAEIRAILGTFKISWGKRTYNIKIKPKHYYFIKAITIVKQNAKKNLSEKLAKQNKKAKGS